MNDDFWVRILGMVLYAKADLLEQDQMLETHNIDLDCVTGTDKDMSMVAGPGC